MSCVRLLIVMKRLYYLLNIHGCNNCIQICEIVSKLEFCPPAVGCIVLKELDDFEGRFDLWFYAPTALLMMIYQIGTDELYDYLSILKLTSVRVLDNKQKLGIYVPLLNIRSLGRTWISNGVSGKALIHSCVH